MAYQTLGTCPQCGTVLKIPVVASKKLYCPACNHHFHVQYGKIKTTTNHYKSFYQNPEDAITYRKIGNRRILIAVICFVIFFTIFWIVFLNDYIVYRNNLKKNTIIAWHSYLQKYPDGWYKKQALWALDSCRYHRALQIANCKSQKCNCNALIDYIRTADQNARFIKQAQNNLELCRFTNAVSDRSIIRMNRFLERYPNSRFYNDLMESKNAIWDSLIHVYQTKAIHNNVDSQAVHFFIRLMDYMRQHNDTIICIRFSNSLNLKEWDDFSPDIRNRIANTVRHKKIKPDNSKMLIINAEKFKSIKQYPPISANDFYTIHRLEMYEKYFQRTLNQMIKRCDTWQPHIVQKQSHYCNNHINVHIQYHIRHQRHSQNNLPVIFHYFRYRKSDAYAKPEKIFLSHYFSVAFDWELTITIPHTSENFRVSQTTISLQSKPLPVDTFVYNMFTSTNFRIFATSIQKLFGFSQKQ